MLIILVILTIDLVNGSSLLKSVGDTGISDFQKQICQCCFDKGKETGCDESTIKSSLDNKNSCLYKINVFVENGIYSKQTINVKQFDKWCRKVLSYEEKITVYLQDMYILSQANLQWNDELKEVMLSSVYDKSNIQNNVKNIEYIMKSTSPNFWIRFHDRITKNKEYVIFCFSYFRECYDYFLAYLFEKEYLWCSKDEVSAIIGSIVSNLDRAELIVKKLSPERIASENNGSQKNGLMFLFCHKANEKSIPNYKLFTEWSVKQLKSFFFFVANLNWPIHQMKLFLKTNPQSLSQFISNEEPYKKLINKWSLEAILHLVNETCLKVDLEQEVIKSVKYYHDINGKCILQIVDIARYSHDYYNLPVSAVRELLSFNYFDELHSKKFGKPINIMEKTKNPSNVLYLMKCLQNSEKRNPKEIVTPDMVAGDYSNLGILSVINFLMLYKGHNVINGKDVDEIISQLSRIQLNVPIDDREKEQNVIKKEDYPENDDPKSINNIRRNSKYEPVYDTKSNEKVKNWGKIVFVAIHAIAIQYNADLIIKKEDIVKNLINCFNDVQTTKQQALYCGIFKSNPYFGEFDNLIKKYFMP